MLVSCTINVLQLLLNQYEFGSLDLESFLENVTLKVNFVKDNMGYIKSANEKMIAEKIIIKCESIAAKVRTS